MSIYESVFHTTPHAFIYEHTDGLIGHRILGGPMPDAPHGRSQDRSDSHQLWKLVNDNNANRYDAYQKKTTRPIPVVALSRTT